VYLEAGFILLVSSVLESREENSVESILTSVTFM
jgi:hypothetical protein